MNLYCLNALPPTPSYKTYACKYLHLCPTLLTKFNSTQAKNLRYSISIIADVGRSAASGSQPNLFIASFLIHSVMLLHSEVVISVSRGVIVLMSEIKFGRRS